MASPSNAERFIAAFSVIEKTLNAITRRPRYIPFRMNARISARYNAVVRNHLEEICSYAELRNCIVHQRDDGMEVVAEPSDATTANIEHIAELLQRDHNVLSFATSPVIIGHGNEALRDVIVRMDDHRIHKLPIYTDGKFQGVLTLQQLLHHALQHEKLTGTVTDLLNDAMKDRVMFVDRKADLSSVVKLFDEFANTDLREPSILVTDHGGIDEDPLGIITLHDLARITTYLA